MTRNPLDIHFYYTKETKETALEIREQFQKTFPELNFYKPHDDPIGPHSTGMWEADFKNVKSEEVDAVLGRAIRWLSLNHKDHSILIHPNTGDGLKDHTNHAIWIGKQLPLKLEAF